MMRLVPTIVVAALAGACASAPRVEGGPPLALDPALAASARVSHVDVEAAAGVVWRYAQTQGEDPPRWDSMADSSFRNAVAWEMENELRRCATGTRPLALRVRIDDIAYDDRFASLFDGKGQDVAAGLVEIVDPGQGGKVVGRYPLRVSVGSGKLLSRILSDRTDALASALGRAVCREAFGRP